MIQEKLVSAVLYVLGGCVALFLAYLNGKRAERINQMREEAAKTAKEQVTKNAIDASVSNMSNSDVRERLQNTKSK